MTRFSRLRLLWRVFIINAALLLVGTLVLVFAPGRVHASLALVETLDLVIGLVVMLTANLLLLRPTLSPVDRLVERMRTVDLLQPGQRLAERGGAEVVAVVHAFNQMLDRLEAERRDSGRRALAAQEAERLRIASGLHDEVGQVLTGLLLQLDAVANADGKVRARRADEAKESIRKALEEVRRIAHELRPELLEHLGLVSALTELSQTFTRTSGVAVERRFARDLPALSDEAELAIYRVAQEGLTNVARHADATRVELTLEPGPGSVVLRVADDHPIVRSGLRTVLDAEPDLQVVAEAEDGAEAVRKAVADDVHLAILDVAMPKLTGIQAAAELHKRRPELKLLMLSMYDSEQFLFESLKAGASGYVLKSDADHDIVDACRKTMRGESFLYPSAIATLVRDYVERRPDEAEFDVLTPRELQVLKLIAEAHSSKEIAAELVISIKTVERHRQNILEKLGMSDRVELTRYAIRRGLIQP